MNALSAKPLSGDLFSGQLKNGAEMTGISIGQHLRSCVMVESKSLRFIEDGEYAHP
jgi:hypothetical protein